MSVFRVVTTPTRLLVGLVLFLAFAVAVIGALGRSLALLSAAALVCVLVAFMWGLASWR